MNRPEPAEIGTDVELAAELLRAGKLVAIPTETVYGLAANGFHAPSIVKIFEAKQRPFFDPLILHTHTINAVSSIVSHIPDKAYQLAERFWPGPLTLVLPKSDAVPDVATAGKPTVGIRVPAHPLTLQLLSILDFPLAAPSANPFGYISPTSAQHVYAQLSDKIEYILDGGACKVGIESTIIGFENEQPTIYRLGGLIIEEIESVIGRVKLLTSEEHNPSAPGMLKSHYAPHKPMYRMEDVSIQMSDTSWVIESSVYSKNEIGALLFDRAIPDLPAKQQIVLSSSGDISEAAQKLFAAMRTLDAMTASVILVGPFPHSGLGKAINDRLSRAVAGK